MTYETKLPPHLLPQFHSDLHNHFGDNEFALPNTAAGVEPPYIVDTVQEELFHLGITPTPELPETPESHPDHDPALHDPVEEYPDDYLTRSVPRKQLKFSDNTKQPGAAPSPPPNPKRKPPPEYPQADATHHMAHDHALPQAATQANATRHTAPKTALLPQAATHANATRHMAPNTALPHAAAQNPQAAPPIFVQQHNPYNPATYAPTPVSIPTTHRDSDQYIYNLLIRNSCYLQL